MSYLYFREVTPSKSLKTRHWEVQNSDTGAVLGLIRFFNAWRKYVFAPLAGTLYDGNCLDEIAKFTEAQTSNWRESNRQ